MPATPKYSKQTQHLFVLKGGNNLSESITLKYKWVKSRERPSLSFSQNKIKLVENPFLRK